jgi:Tfp pilus assembly protein PilF
MKPIYQVLSVIGLTAILTSQTSLSKAQNEPIVSPSRVLYIAKINAKDLVNRAVMKAQSGDNQGAIEDLTEAIKMESKYAPAYHYRGIVRSAIGDKSGAIVDFQSAANLFQQQGKMDDYQLAMNAILYLQR